MSGWFDALSQIALDGLAVVASALVPVILWQIQKRTGLEISEKWDKRARDLADLAINYARNYGRGKLQSYGTRVPGHELADKAAEYFVANAYGPLERWGTEKLQEYIAARFDAQRAVVADLEKLESAASRMVKTIDDKWAEFDRNMASIRKLNDG